MSRISIITIGLSPAWDITCRGRNIDWGLHQEIDEQTVRPAGKALKVATARAWGWTEKKTWPQAQREIKVAIEPV